MTQEEADKVFETDLGRQLEVIYVTSDNQPFIRYEEAASHASELLNTEITEWYPS